MAQIKIYGLKHHLDKVKHDLSNVIHECIVSILKFPENKRAHRFISLDKADFYYPDGEEVLLSLLK